MPLVVVALHARDIFQSPTQWLHPSSIITVVATSSYGAGFISSHNLQKNCWRKYFWVWRWQVPPEQCFKSAILFLSCQSIVRKIEVICWGRNQLKQPHLSSIFTWVAVSSHGVRFISSHNLKKIVHESISGYGSHKYPTNNVSKLRHISVLSIYCQKH